MGDPEQETDLFGDPLPAGRSRGRRGAVAADLWRAWLADPATVDRYRAAICWRGTTSCAYWLSSLSSTGHAKLRVGSHTDGTRHVVNGHVYGYQLAHGLIDTTADVVVAHRCDEPSCQQPAHLQLVDRLDNNEQYAARRGSGPLADVRGARGRAVAIRDAILATQAAGADIEAAIAAARVAGLPPTPDALF